MIGMKISIRDYTSTVDLKINVTILEAPLSSSVSLVKF